MPAAEAWETTNVDAFSVAPAVAVIRNASALQWWSWNAPPSMIHSAVTAITSPPEEDFEENIPAQTHMVFIYAVLKYCCEIGLQKSTGL